MEWYSLEDRELGLYDDEASTPSESDDSNPDDLDKDMQDHDEDQAGSHQ